MLNSPGLLVFLGLVVSGVLSALHLALMDLTRGTLEDLTERQGSRGARARVAKILDDVRGHARSVALVRVVFNLLAVVSLVWWVAGVEAMIGHSTADAVSPGARSLVVEPRHAVLAVAIGAALLWFVSVIIPQSWARHGGEMLVLRASGLVRVIHVAMRPLGAIERAIDWVVRALVGKRDGDASAELEAELMSVVDEGEREGKLDQDQAQMIEAVVKLRQTTVGQIMTPRREVEYLEMTGNLGVLTAFVRKARHSRIPVIRAGGDLDDVIGFFYVKDLLKWLAGETGASAAGGEHKGSGRGFDLKAILRPALFVPETKTVREISQEFMDKRVHIAMVADEYGGTAGLVCLEDVIEEVFGEIQDEYEKAEDDPPRIEMKMGEYVADIDARAYIEDVNEALESMGVHIPEADDYDTLGGFVTTHMGRIPESNESFEHGPAVVTVLEATPMRVVKVRVALRADEREARERDAADAAARAGEGGSSPGVSEAGTRDTEQRSGL